METTLMTLDGHRSEIGQDAVRALEASLAGRLLRAQDDGYDAARAFWNGMIDKRPGLIVQCANAGDVAAAMDAAHPRRPCT